MKCKPGELLSLPGLPWAQDNLHLTEGVGTVVSHYIELNPIQITPPQLQSMHHCQKLLLTSSLYKLGPAHLAVAMAVEEVSARRCCTHNACIADLPRLAVFRS